MCFINYAQCLVLTLSYLLLNLYLFRNLIIFIVKQQRSEGMNQQFIAGLQKNHNRYIKEQFARFFNDQNWKNELKRMWMDHFHSFINKDNFSRDCSHELSEAKQKIELFLQFQNHNQKTQLSQNKFYGYMILGMIYFYGQNFSLSTTYFEKALSIQTTYNKNLIIIYEAFACFSSDSTRQNTFFGKMSFQNFNSEDLQQFKHTINVLERNLVKRNSRNPIKNGIFLLKFLQELIQIYMKFRFVVNCKEHINLSRQFGLNKRIVLSITMLLVCFHLNMNQFFKRQQSSLNFQIFCAQHQFFQQRYRKSIKLLTKVYQNAERLQNDKVRERQQKILNAQCEYILILMIQALLKQKLFEQAKQFIEILIRKHQDNGYGYYYMGLIQQKQDKKDKSFQSFKTSLKIYESRQCLSALSGLCYESKDYTQAIFYTKAFINNPFSKLSYKIFDQAEEYFKQSQKFKYGYFYYEQLVKTNVQQLSCLLELAKYSQINQQTKAFCDRIIENLLKSKTHNLKTKFNISCYYFITKNHNYEDRYEQYIRKFLSREDNTMKEIYPNILQSIIALHQKTYSFSNMFPSETTSFLFLGVMSRVASDYKLSHEFYRQFIANIQIFSKKTQLVNLFEQIYVNILMGFSQSFRSFYLQFLIIEMIESDPQSVIECYYKSLNYCSNDYGEFCIAIKKKIRSSIQILTDLILNLRLIEDGQEVYTKDNLFSDILKCAQINLYIIQQLPKNTPQETVIMLFKWLNIQYDDIKETNEFERELLINKLISTQQLIKYRSKQPQFYITIYEQQMELRQQIRSILKKNSTTGSYQQLHKMFQKLLIPFYQNKYVRNQMIKIIYQRVYIYVFQDDAKAKLNIICNRIMKNPYYIYTNLSNQLMEAFELKDKSTPPSIITFSLGYSYNPSDCNNEKSLKSCGEEVIQDINNEKPRKRTNSETKSEQKIQSKWFQQNDIFENDDKDLNKRREQKLKIVIFKAFQKENINKQIECQDNLDQSQIQIQKKYPDNLYDKSYEINNTKTGFPNKTKYWQVQKHFFQKNCLIIKYLDSKKPECKRIAKYYTKTKEINLDDHDIKNKKFSFKIQKGDMPRYLNSQKQKKISKQWLMQQGEYFVVEWIICVAGGIIELQRFGIYNPDIAFRNTIKISQTEKYDTFKMIDFDSAFPVETGQSHPQLLEKMKEIIHFWLTFDFDSKSPLPQNMQDIIQNKIPSETINQYYIQEIITFIFSRADKTIIDQIVALKQKDKFSKEKREKIMQMLKIHMHESHLKQFCRLVKKLLSKQMIEIYPGTMNQSMTSIILQQLDRLQHKEIIYQKFMDNIQAYRQQFRKNEIK